MSLARKTDQDWNPIERNQGSSTYNEFSDNDYPEQRKRLLNALGYLKSLEDNWNGYDATKPSPQAIAMAEHFVTYLFLTKEHADFIEPNGDGGLILKWLRGDMRILLTIDGTALHLSYEEGSNEPIFIENIRFFDASNKILPKEILQHIPNRAANASNGTDRGR